MSTIIEPSGWAAPGKPSAGAAVAGAHGARSGASILLPVAGAIALLAALAWPMLTNWYWQYTRPDSYYSHAFAIPFLAGLMLWHRRGALRAAPVKPCPAALSVFLPALALLVLAVETESHALMTWAFLLVMTSGVWFLVGTQAFRAAAFPLGFLWLMGPLPDSLLNDATHGMQMLSTVGAGKLLYFMAFSPVRDGNLIVMENFTLNVGTACSGFNLLLRLLTFSAAFAYLSDTTMARRWTIFLLSLPLSLAINVLRIALIGVAGECATS
jgi:exosortase